MVERPGTDFHRIGNDNSVLANRYGIAGLEHNHFYPLAIHEGAVEAAEVLEHQAAVFGEDAGVVIRHRRVIDDHAIFRRAADAHFFLADRDFLQHR